MAAIKAIIQEIEEFENGVDKKELVEITQKLAETKKELDEAKIQLDRFEEIDEKDDRFIYIGDGQGFNAEGIKKLVEKNEEYILEIEKLNSIQIEYLVLKKENEELKSIIDGKPEAIDAAQGDNKPGDEPEDEEETESVEDEKEE